MNARDATNFPRSLAAHPGAAIEWWYVTGTTATGPGRARGFELTFFRARIPGETVPAPPGASAWRPRDLYFAHFAVTDPASNLFRYDERVGRTSVALAGADSTRLDVWIGDWSLRRLGNGSFSLDAAGTPGTLRLTLAPSRPRPVAWGPDYISYKDEARRTYSRYQTYPRLAVSGTYAPPGQTPVPVRGQAWLDHEWSDGVMDPAVAGWDWMGLRVVDGRSVMIYRMRDRAGRTAHLYAGIVEADGTVRAYGRRDVTLTPLRTWTSPRTGARYPVVWRVLIGPPGEPPIELQVSPAVNDQELDTRRSTQVIYWEGLVTGRLKEGDRQLPAEGYLELTGYAGNGSPVAY
jgi:predicted secreted hydrolase